MLPEKLLGSFFFFKKRQHKKEKLKTCFFLTNVFKPLCAFSLESLSLSLAKPFVTRTVNVEVLLSVLFAFIEGPFSLCPYKPFRRKGLYLFLGLDHGELLFPVSFTFIKGHLLSFF